MGSLTKRLDTARPAKVFLFSLSLSLSLLAGEAGYRSLKIKGYEHLIRSAQYDPLYQIYPGSGFVYRLKPHLVRKDIRGNQEAPWSFRTNALGFRGPELAEKRAGRQRIVVLGDSYTFGWAVNEEFTFPRILERRVNARLKKERVEVINAGVPGYNTVQELALLQEVFPEVHPDVVVLGYVMNDAEPQRSVPPDPHEVYRWSRSWLFEDAVELLNQKTGRVLLTSRKYTDDGHYAAGFAADSPKWRESHKAFRDIARLCTARNVPFFLFIFPAFAQPFDASYDLAFVHRAVQAWAEESGVQVLDLLPLFQGRDHEDYWVPGDGHPNRRAFQVIGERIADELWHRGIVSGD